MGNALKTFVVLNFLLSIAVVVLGVFVFKDREVIKARTLMLEKTVADVGTNLKYDGTSGMVSSLKPETKEELPAMQSALGRLATFSDATKKELESTIDTLAQTRNTLEQTQNTLTITQGELADARVEIQGLNETLTQTQNDLRDERRKVDNLVQEKRALEGQIADLNNEVTERDNQISSLTIDLETRTGELKRVEGLLEACERGAAGDEEDAGDWKGRTAQILTVEPDWDYVVIDKGTVDALPMYLQAFVHRGENYIGKLTVVRVEESVAVAEIQRQSMIDGAALQPGDRVFF